MQKTLSFILTEDKFTRYSINTIFSPWFSKYWIFSLGGMFGFSSNDYSSFFPSYTFGTGGSYDFDRVRINLLLNYSRSFNPENIRTAKNKSIGRDLFGLNFNMQYKYGADSNYNFSIGVLQYLDDYSIKNSINQFNIYLGLGFTLDINFSTDSNKRITPFIRTESSR